MFKNVNFDKQFYPILTQTNTFIVSGRDNE